MTRVQTLLGRPRRARRKGLDAGPRGRRCLPLFACDQRALNGRGAAADYWLLDINSRSDSGE